MTATIRDAVPPAASRGLPLDAHIVAIQPPSEALRGVPLTYRDEPAEVGLPCPQDRSRGSCRRHPGDCRRMPLSLPYSPLRGFARAFPIDCALAGHRPPVGSGRCLLRLNSTAGIPPNRRTPGLRPSKEGAETGMGFLSPYQPVRSPVSERQEGPIAHRRGCRRASCAPYGLCQTPIPFPEPQGTSPEIPHAGSAPPDQVPVHRPVPGLPYAVLSCPPMPLRRAGSVAERYPSRTPYPGPNMPSETLRLAAPAILYAVPRIPRPVLPKLRRGPCHPACHAPRGCTSRASCLPHRWSQPPIPPKRCGRAPRVSGRPTAPDNRTNTPTTDPAD